MNDGVFNLTPATLAKIKESQANIWKMGPGQNGETPPEVVDNSPWSHEWVEKVKVEKVERINEDNNVTVIKVTLRCVEGINLNRVHTEWLRLYPPFDDGGFGRRTLENLNKVGQLVTAAGFGPEVLQTNLLSGATSVPVGTQLLVKMRAFCEFNRKRSQYFTGMEVSEFAS